MKTTLLGDGLIVSAQGLGAMAMIAFYGAFDARAESGRAYDAPNRRGSKADIREPGTPRCPRRAPVHAVSIQGDARHERAVSRGRLLSRLGGSTA
jgi:hypothetical protein